MRVKENEQGVAPSCGGVSELVDGVSEQCPSGHANMGTLTLFDSVITAITPENGARHQFQRGLFLHRNFFKKLKKDHNIGVGIEGQERTSRESPIVEGSASRQPSGRPGELQRPMSRGGGGLRAATAWPTRRRCTSGRPASVPSGRPGELHVWPTRRVARLTWRVARLAVTLCNGLRVLRPSTTRP
jgi:hypothetical protein